jgi:putative flippase GtrA
VTMPLLKKFVRFSMVGGIATALHWGVLVASVEILGAHEVSASTMGYVGSSFLNYWLNRRWTFQSGRAHRAALPRFAAIATGGLALNAMVMSILVSTVGVPYLLAQFIATLIVLIWNFVANAKWTFRDPEYRVGRQSNER